MSYKIGEIYEYNEGTNVIFKVIEINNENNVDIEILEVIKRSKNTREEVQVGNTIRMCNFEFTNITLASNYIINKKLEVICNGRS
jgi:hypothetical protein